MHMMTPLTGAFHMHSQSWDVYMVNLNQVTVLKHELVLCLQDRPRD